MKNKPTVSVIIPAYNSSAFLPKLIDSLEHQTWKNFEVIVIDDGSSDCTSQVITSYINEGHLSFSLLSQENQGVSAARNAGLALSKGEFCVFIDSDDYVEPDFLERLVDRQHQTGGDFIYSGFVHHSSKGEVRNPRSFKEGDILLNRITREVLFHLGGALIRREYLTKNNIVFDKNLRFGEDLLFCYTLLSKLNAYATPSYLYHQVARENSVMSSVWSLSDYENNLEAMLLIQKVVGTSYKGSHEQAVVVEMHKIVASAKIKLLWAALKQKKYTFVSERINEGFTNLKQSELSALTKKDKKKLSVIKTNSKIFWSLYFLFRK